MRPAPTQLLSLAAIVGLAFPAVALAQDADQQAPPAPADAPAGEVPAEEAKPEPAPEPTEEEIRAKVAELNADEFAVREAASLALWKMGRAAEPYIREAIKDNRGELRYRGRKLLDDFELGIYPDTPEEVRRLLMQYRNAPDRRTREQAIRQLAQLDQTELLAELVRRERDPAMRELIASVLGDGVQRLAPALIANGDYDQAEELLKIAAIGSQGMANYVAFLSGRGTLEAAITQQRERVDDSNLDAVLYGWMLRANGQFDEAIECFEEAKETLLAKQTRGSAGDRLAFAESCVDETRSDITTLAYQLAVARLSGNKDDVLKHIESIRRYAMAIKEESPQCLSALFLNGYGEEAFDLARKLELDDLPAIAIARHDFAETFRALGAESVTAPYDKWLDAFLADFKVERELDIPDLMQPAHVFIGACVDTGQEAEAKRILSRISQRLAKNGDSQLIIVSTAARHGLMDFAIESAVKAMELDTELTTIGALYETDADSSRGLRDELWDYLRETKPDQSSAKAMRELGALLGYAGMGEVDPAPAIAALRAKAEAAEPAEKAGFLLFAADLANQHTRLDDANDAYAAALLHIGVDARLSHHFDFAKTLLAAERYRDAAEQFDLAWKINTSNPIPYYFKGLCLHRAGDVEEGNALRERSALMALANSYTLFTLGSNAYLYDDFDYSLAANRAIIRLTAPNRLPGSRRFASPHDVIYRISTGQRDFATAADALEMANLSRLRSAYYSASFPMAYRMDWSKVKARALLDAGDVEGALAITREAIKLNPADSSMLEDVYQLLVDNGKTAEADGFFETAFKPAFDAAKTFPNRGQHHNNLAWLLSRTGKKLDLALETAKKAVELEPENGAFLDTLAEVHFQRGERDKAIAASEQAIVHLGSDAQLIHQLERFKNGKPTDR